MTLQADSIPKKDLLSRKQFASEISRNIDNYFSSENESLVIGIHGAWGSGKSTLLNYIKEDFTDKSISIMEFNPWMFSGKNELHYIFLNELALKIGHRKQEIRNSIKQIASRFA